MSYSISPPMFLQFFVPGSSAPLSGGKLFTYAAGTTTKQATYATQANGNANVPNANPIILDANGICQVFLNNSLNYKFVIAGPNDTDPPTSPYYTTDDIQSFLILSPYYAQTQAEITVSVTPTNYTYPQGNVFRYGAIGTGNSTYATQDTTALSNAIAVEQQVSGAVTIPDGCNLVCNGISVSVTGGRYSSSLTINGTSPAGSKITQNSSLLSGAMISFIGSGGLVEANLSFNNIELEGIGASGSTTNGILLQNIAYFHFNNCLITGFQYGVYLQSALIGDFIDCNVGANQIGYYSRYYTSAVYNNLINIINGRIIDNIVYGADVGQGAGWYFRGVDIEQNGNSLNPTVATSGGVILRSTITAEDGDGQVSFYQCWFEGNYGWACQTEAVSSLQLTMRDTLLFGNEANQAGVLNVVGAGSVTLDNVVTSAVADDVVNIGSTQGAVGQFNARNVTIATLTDLSSFPYYEGVYPNSGSQADGRVVSNLVGLTGMSVATVTGTIISKQQGQNVTLNCAASTGTSNATTFTLGTSGTATAGTVNSLTDTGQTWTTNQWAGCWLVNVTNSLSALVTSNTATVLTVPTMATANASGNTYIIGGLPLSIAPGTARQVTFPFENNTANAIGLASIATSGLVTISLPGGITSSGTKGLIVASVVYPR